MDAKGKTKRVCDGGATPSQHQREDAKQAVPVGKLQSEQRLQKKGAIRSWIFFRRSRQIGWFSALAGRTDGPLQTTHAAA